MDHIRYIALACLLLPGGCRSEDVDASSAKTVSPPRTAVAAKDAFIVQFPSNSNWKPILDGKVQEIDGSHMVAVGNPESQTNLVVMVLPALKPRQPFDVAKQEWKSGFLKKMTRQKSENDTKINGHDAFEVIGEFDADDRTTYEIVGIWLTAGDWNYTISVTKNSAIANDDSEIQRFIKSFRPLDGSGHKSDDE